MITDNLVWQKISTLLSDTTQIRSHADRWLRAHESDGIETED
jgi:hypothetical protein